MQKSFNAPLPPPMNAYAVTKIMGEERAKFYYICFRIPIVVTRLYTVYGPRQRMTMAISKFMQLLLDNNEIPAYDDGLFTRDYLNIHDCIQDIRLAMLQNDEFEIFNISSNSVVNVLEITETLSRLTGKKAGIRFIPPDKQVPLASIGDIRKAKEILNFHPSVTFGDGIEDYYQWHKDNLS
ncbi:MAG: GDP-mannose 4,6-dehydratase [Bacteroidia bacterium]|nr:GDP-mannose 4,6-dehydratase [Bacteroidia bacterium]